MSDTPPKKGSIVKYCYQPVEQKIDYRGDPDGPATPVGEPQDMRAMVVQVHADGEIDLGVLTADGTLICGVTRPKKATAAADRIKPGHWWP